jgi:hypothetical protein
MKIISIIKNDVTNSDLAIYLKDNYPHDLDDLPTPPHNTAEIAYTKSGMPVLQIEFWRNPRFQKFFWRGEVVSVIQDEDTDFVKHGSPWLEFLEVYESF